MFYCDDCGKKNGWPTDAMLRSRGRCEICTQVAVCNDIASSDLPLSNETPDPNELLRAARKIADPRIFGSELRGNTRYAVVEVAMEDWDTFRSAVKKNEERIKSAIEFLDQGCSSCKDCAKDACKAWTLRKILNGEPYKSCESCGEYHYQEGDRCDVCK